MENSLYKPLPIMEKVACEYPLNKEVCVSIINKGVRISKYGKMQDFLPKTTEEELQAVREAYERGETYGRK